MKKVLLIEDDMVLRENTAELLELSNYHVITAPDGKKGVKAAMELVPDIVVCDIMMPEMDGYGVLQQLSTENRTKHIPFIFLSAKTERKEVRLGMDLGADDYLTKPFEESELVSAIESRLAKVEILKEEHLLTESKQAKKETICNLNQLKNFFFDHGNYFTFEEGETIYAQGNHIKHIFLIEKGIVKNFRIDEFGRELITSIAKDDDFFGFVSFTSNALYRETAVALNKVTAYGLNVSVLAKILAENHQVALEWVEFLSEDLSALKEQLLQMAYATARKKTACSILQFVNKLKHREREGIKISRQDLARVAGIATESLIRALSDFKKEGLITMEGRNIKVLDLSGLQKVK